MASALAQITTLLGQYLRVSVADGRVLVGRLSCIDAVGNVVLSDCEEAPAAAAGETRVEAARRWLGLVSINSKHVVSIWCDSRALALPQ